MRTFSRLDGTGEDVIVTVKVKEFQEKPGKPIYITAETKMGTVQLLADKRCVGNTDEDELCKPCKLRFRCFSSDALRLSVERDLGELPCGDIEPTIGEMIDMFLARNGVDLTKLEARAKIIEAEEKAREEAEAKKDDETPLQ